MDGADWSISLKQIERELLSLDAVPQLGPLPPFPYSALAEHLASQFNLSSLSIEETGSRWADRQEALADLGNPLTHLTLAAPPFEGALYFAIPTQDLQRLMQRLLGGDPYSAALYDSDLREGFLEFLTAQVLSAVEALGYPVSANLAAKAPLPDGPLFVRNLKLADCHARLLLTPTLTSSIRTHYEGEKAPLSPELAQSVHLSLGAEVGASQLSGEEWQRLAKGDFVALDECSIDPTTREGQARLSIEGRPLFDGQVGPKGVTITGLAGY